MAPSTPPGREPGLSAALHERYAVLIERSELSLSRALELCGLAESAASLAVREGGCPREALLIGSMAACAAAVASSPDISDLLVGKVTVQSGDRRFVVPHTRRYLDPEDWLVGFGMALAAGDRSAEDALSLAIAHVEVPPVLKGREASARRFYELAYSAFLQCRTPAAAPLAKAAMDMVEELCAGLSGEHLEARIRKIVAPALALIAAEPGAREAMLREAVTEHLRYHADYSRPEDPRAEVNWPLRAIVKALDIKPPYPKGTAFPEVSGDGAVGISYTTPVLRARCLGEARVRALTVKSSATIVGESRSGDCLTIAVTAAGVDYQLVFQLPADADEPEQDLGTGPSPLLDAGELRAFAERSVSDPSIERALARRAIAEAIKWVFCTDVLYRDRMTSAVGRRMADEHPELLSPEALRELSALLLAGAS